MKSKVIFKFLLICLFLVLTTDGFCLPILGAYSSDGGATWGASGGGTRNASATFSIVDDDTLLITLTNLGITGVPNEVLTGLYFGTTGGYSLFNPDVEVAAGSLLIGSVTGGPGTSLNNRFAFRSGLNSLNGNIGEYGICASGFDPLGFGGYIIEPPPNSPGGADYGLVGTLSRPKLPSSIDPYVQSSILITLGFSGPISLDDIGQVNFLYGTDSAAPVPEPSSVLLFSIGLIGYMGFRRKFKKA